MRACRWKPGDDPNELDHNGWSPLYAACWEGEVELAQAIIAAGGHVDPIFSPPLHAAAMGGHLVRLGQG